MRWAAGLSVTGAPSNPHPAKVLNLSLGSTGVCTQAYQDVVDELTALGVVIVAAAGNDGLAVGTPANCSGVIAVAGVRHTGTKVGYSNLGSQVTIAAPAGNCVSETGACLYPILSTSNAGTATPGAASYTDSVDYAVGTSFSSPIVAGTVALMLSANPALTPAQIKAFLQSSARAFPSSGAASSVSACQAPGAIAQDSECYCTKSTCGAGLLDAGAAVRAAAPATTTTTSSSAASSATADTSTSAGDQGGGALAPLWALGLAGAIGALARRRTSDRP